MTYTIEAEADELYRDESFDTIEELADWIGEFVTENNDTAEFNVTIINDLQTGDSG
jgi:hypothetical protein